MSTKDYCYDIIVKEKKNLINNLLVTISNRFLKKVNDLVKTLLNLMKNFLLILAWHFSLEITNKFVSISKQGQNL